MSLDADILNLMDKAKLFGSFAIATTAIIGGVELALAVEQVSIGNLRSAAAYGLGGIINVYAAGFMYGAFSQYRDNLKKILVDQ